MIQVGDVVTRRDAIVDMTVAALNGDGTVFCQWFEGTALREGSFPVDDLEVVGEKRQLVRVITDPCVLTELFTQGAIVGGENDIIKCVKGVPFGSKLVGMAVDGGRLVLTYHHKSFPVIPKGGEVPEMEIQLSRAGCARAL